MSMIHLKLRRESNLDPKVVITVFSDGTVGIPSRPEEGVGGVVLASESVRLAYEILKANGIEVATDKTMNSKRIFIELVERMRRESCGAINPFTGISDSIGYGLEIYPEARQTVDKPTVENVTAFFDQNIKLFEETPNTKQLRLGWDNFGRELNIGVRGFSKTDAMGVAAALDQRAIFDIRNQKEIEIGGSGKQTFFPDYPLQRRLEDLGLA